MPKPEQRWRPISLMPAFKYAVSCAAESAREQAENMGVAIDQAGSIHRAELVRMQWVYDNTAQYAYMCSEQVHRWRSEGTTPAQADALDQLDAIVAQWMGDVQFVIDAVKILLRDEDG